MEKAFTVAEMRDVSPTDVKRESFMVVYYVKSNIM